jgi:hypothetical protein
MDITKSNHITTTFHISPDQHTQLKMMCVLTKKSMGEFIRIALAEKIDELKRRGPNVPRV